MPLIRRPRADAETHVPLPPPPRRTPVIDAATGLMQRAWVTWLELSYRRQGEAHAPSNAELDEAMTGSQDALQALQAELDATQAALAATQAALAQTQADLETAEAALVALQADLETTQADLAALMPPGTARAVARYQSDASGVEASGATLSDTGTLVLPGALEVGDGQLTRVNLGLGAADLVHFGRLGLGVAANAVTRLVFLRAVESKVLYFGTTVTERYGLGIANAGLEHFVPAASAANRHAWGSMAADGTTFTPQLVLYTQTGNVGIGIAPPLFALHVPGRVAFGVPSTAPTDANLGNNQLSIWVNGSTLTFRVKNTAGAMQTATLALT